MADINLDLPFTKKNVQGDVPVELKVLPVVAEAKKTAEDHKAKQAAPPAAASGAQKASSGQATPTTKRPAAPGGQQDAEPANSRKKRQEQAFVEQIEAQQRQQSEAQTGALKSEWLRETAGEPI